jgi:hypothetical protein
MLIMNKLMPKVISGVVLACLCLAAMPGALGADKKTEESQPVEGRLIYSDDWSFLSGLAAPMAPVQRIKDNDTTMINLPNPKNPKGFRCLADQGKLELDTDGDGAYDAIIKNKENFVVYKIQYPNGVQLNYQMRFFARPPTPYDTQNAWYCQRACFMTVKTSLGDFTLIDDNNNGYYNDYGQDSIIIGTMDKKAIPLSAVIKVKGKFYALHIESLSEIPEDAKKMANYTGMVLRLEPYEGATGRINLVQNLNPPKDPPETIFIRSGNDIFFQLGKETAVVPAGEYWLVSAVFTKRIHAGKSESSLGAVEKDKVLAPKWGGPFKLNLKPYCEFGGEIPIINRPVTSESRPIPLPILSTYTPKYIDCPFIKMNLPSITGALGEEYYASDEFKDEKGWAFADGGVSLFNVEIRPKDAQSNQRPINKTVGNYYVEKWIPVDLSSQGRKAAPFWEPYRCPIEKYHGAVIVRVTIPSKIFGSLLFEQEVMVK